MAVTTKVVQLDWEIPTRILAADNKRIYARFYVDGEYFYLGGVSVTHDNGIQVSWRNAQELQTPECQYEFYAVGQGKIRVLEVTTSASA